MRNKCILCSVNFIATGDEMFSDTYPMKLVSDCLYEVTGKVIFNDYNILIQGYCGENNPWIVSRIQMINC